MANRSDTFAATGAQAVTPHDSNTIAACRALYVGGAGNIAVVTVDGNAVTFVGAVAGSTIPVQVSAVKSTGTTATNIVALY